MKEGKGFDNLLSQYDEQVFRTALQLRELLPSCLPGIIEQVDLPAKMVGYCYGQKYAELICVMIPSKKGLKLGFNQGVDLNDPDKLLGGTGKISRYLEIKTGEKLKAAVIKKFLKNALVLYKQRMLAITK